MAVPHDATGRPLLVRDTLRHRDEDHRTVLGVDHPGVRLRDPALQGGLLLLARVDQLDDISREGTPARVTPDQTAFIQFSSGSTSDPKGVVLTHRQVLANIDAIAAALEIAPGDCLVNPLPLFHSFGLVPGTFLGLCAGIRIAGQADPSDGSELGKLIEAQRGTILLGTATFAVCDVTAPRGLQVLSNQPLVERKPVARGTLPSTVSTS